MENSDFKVIDMFTLDEFKAAVGHPDSKLRFGKCKEGQESKFMLSHHEGEDPVPSYFCLLESTGIVDSTNTKYTRTGQNLKPENRLKVTGTPCSNFNPLKPAVFSFVENIKTGQRFWRLDNGYDSFMTAVPGLDD